MTIKSVFLAGCYSSCTTATFSRVMEEEILWWKGMIGIMTTCSSFCKYSTINYSVINISKTYCDGIERLVLWQQAPLVVTTNLLYTNLKRPMSKNYGIIKIMTTRVFDINGKTKTWVSQLFEMYYKSNDIYFLQSAKDKKPVLKIT